MTNCPIADDGFTFDDLSDDGDLVVGKQHADTFADRSRVATDGNKMSITTHADRNVTSKTQDAFCT
jgi:hypothetical protein